jgi:glycosyltransferase involved in cell wall biosynthesis
MKVLWFTNTSSLFNKGTHYYNGGGWIESLESIISNDDRVELAISFFHSDDRFKVSTDKVTYYPVSIYNSTANRLARNFDAQKTNQKEVDAYMKVIDDFKPDLIHVFGSERSFGLIASQTKVPVIIHIQGILNPYLNAWFAPGTNQVDEFIHNDFKTFLKNMKALILFRRNSERERKIFEGCRYFMGRTEWDKSVSKLLSPHSRYYRCEEALRLPFYEAAPWRKRETPQFQITTTISKNSYKGYDLVLKTAKLLKEVTNIDFQWNIHGIKDYKYWNKKLKINPSDVNVVVKGVANVNELIQALTTADVFIHPSYIDNSPNSVCEAQILGVPVISTNAGGISSLIEDGETGLLVNTNDPFMLASKIKFLFENESVRIRLGFNARKVALSRHSYEGIHNTIYNTYVDLKEKSNVELIR